MYGDDDDAIVVRRDVGLSNRFVGPELSGLLHEVFEPNDFVRARLLRSSCRESDVVEE